MEGKTRDDSSRLIVTFYADQMEAMRRVAEEDGCSIAQLVRTAVSRLLRQRWEAEAQAHPVGDSAGLSDSEARVLQLVGEGRHTDADLVAAGVDVKQVGALTMALRLKGRLRYRFGRFYR